MLEIITVEREIKALLQINNVNQSLDSLESIVVQSFLKSQGITDRLTPDENTIKGWITCLHKYLGAGQNTSAT